MTREQIGRALEYGSEEYVKKLHKNNQNILNPLSVEISTLAKGGIANTPLSNPENKRKTQTIDDLMLSKLHPDTLLYNEDGIYEITFLSRQPRANEFRAWVKERIKEIRKFGFTTATDGDFLLAKTQHNQKSMFFMAIDNDSDTSICVWANSVILC